jgi:hypothetical protein
LPIDAERRLELEKQLSCDKTTWSQNMQVLMACMMEQQQQQQQSVQAANPISSDPPQSSGTLQKPSPSALANRGEQADSLPIPKRMDRMCRQRNGCQINFYEQYEAIFKNLVNSVRIYVFFGVGHFLISLKFYKSDASFEPSRPRPFSRVKSKKTRITILSMFSGRRGRGALAMAATAMAATVTARRQRRRWQRQRRRGDSDGEATATAEPEARGKHLIAALVLLLFVQLFVGKVAQIARRPKSKL